MNTSRTTRLLCAAAALITTLSLFSGVIALGDVDSAPTRMAQAPSTSTR
jgi:hypothetical protein